jgi:hypothetical protein
MIVLLLNVALAEFEESIPQETESGGIVGDVVEQERISPEPPVPEVWFQCTPVSGLIEMWEVFPQAMKDNAGGFAQATPESFVEAGGVLDGTLVAYGSEELHLELDYNGDASQVPSMLELMVNDGVIWQNDENSWFVELPDDRWFVNLSEGKLNMQSVSTQDEQSIKPSFASILPQENGCVAVIENGPPLPQLNKPLEGGFFMPFDDAPIQLVYPTDSSFPELPEQSTGTPLDVKTKSNPVLVLSLGVSPLTLLSDPVINSKLQIPEKDLKKLQRRLIIPAGTLMALGDFNVRENPNVLLAVPMHNRLGRDRGAFFIWRGLTKSLKNSSLDYLTLDKHILSLEREGVVFFLSAQKGRLLVSTTREGLDDMIRNEGTPWVDEDLLRFSQEWPISAQLKLPPMMGMMIGGLSTIDLGIKSKEEYAIIALATKFNSGQSNMKGLLQLITSRPEFNNSEKEVVEEHTMIMMNIAAKEHQQFASKGEYVAVGRTGDYQKIHADDGLIPANETNDVSEELTEEQVEELDKQYQIPKNSSAVELEWITETDKNVYWVETTSEGFLVHALVQGDTVIHLTRDHNAQVERVD